MNKLDQQFLKETIAELEKLKDECEHVSIGLARHIYGLKRVLSHQKEEHK